MTSQNGFKMSQNLIKIYRNLYNLQHKSYQGTVITGSQEFLNLINDHILKHHEYFCDVNILPCCGLMVTVNIRLLSLIIKASSECVLYFIYLHSSLYAIDV